MMWGELVKTGYLLCAALPRAAAFVPGFLIQIFQVTKQKTAAEILIIGLLHSIRQELFYTRKPLGVILQMRYMQLLPLRTEDSSAAVILCHLYRETKRKPVWVMRITG